MKKIIYANIIFLLIFQAGIAHADKEQAVFAIQKTKAYIEKIRAKSEEMKAPAEGLQKASMYLGQAESILKNNTSILGKLKKEAEPDILYYSEMAETSAAITSAKLDKMIQEKEMARLEKMIPEVEAKIKVFMDKNAEIQRLTEEIKKPTGSLQTMGSELALLKKEKAKLAEQTSQLMLEKENLKGKLEAVEKQKGSDIVEMRASLHSANRKVDFFMTLGTFGYLAKMSGKGMTLIIPRKALLKITPKGPVLDAGADQHITKFVSLFKDCPESKFRIDVHGFGTPARNEDKKATESMAHLIKEAFIKNGITESAIEISGAGSGSPLFSKNAIDENRRVEITVYQ